MISPFEVTTLGELPRTQYPFQTLRLSGTDNTLFWNGFAWFVAGGIFVVAMLRSKR